MAERHGIEVVRCEPYLAWLKSENCVHRYRKAQTIPKRAPAGNAALHRLKLLESVGRCQECPEGLARAREAAERGDDIDQATAPTGGIVPAGQEGQDHERGTDF